MQYDFYSEGHVSESDWLTDSDTEDEYKRPAVSQQSRLHSLLKRDLNSTGITKLSPVNASKPETSDDAVQLDAFAILVDEVTNSSEILETNNTNTSLTKTNGTSFGEALLSFLSPLNFFIKKELESVKPDEVIVNNQTVSKKDDTELVEVTSHVPPSTEAAGNLTEVTTEGLRKRTTNALSTEATKAATVALTEVTTETVEKRDATGLNVTEKAIVAPQESTSTSTLASTSTSTSTSTITSTSTETVTESNEKRAATEKASTSTNTEVAPTASTSTSDSTSTTTEREIVISSSNVPTLVHIKLNRDVPGGAVITDDIVEKIAEIQAPPVILTQGI